MSPAKQQRLFLALHEAHEQRRASQVSGTCEWQTAFVSRIINDVSAGRTPDETGYDEHVSSCSICSAHEAWDNANPFPLGLPAEPLWSKVFGLLVAPAITDNVAVPLLVGGAGIATALLVRLALPASPYWEGVFWPLGSYIGVVVGVSCYRVLSSMTGREGIGGWLARLGAWVSGTTLAIGIPMTVGSPSLEDALDPRFGLSGLVASMAVMVLLFSIFFRE